MQATLTLIAAIGRTVLTLMRQTGAVFLFSISAIAAAFRPPFYLRETLVQLWRIGYESLPVVGLTALFTGAALALQIYVGSSDLNAEAVVPRIVSFAVARELGPVLAGLMVAGRVSASIAAELGTMRVTEQIDALTTLSTDPMRYLVAPRIVAATLALPVLVAVADSIGIFGGYLVGVERLGFNGAIYLKTTTEHLMASDVVSGLWKAAAFGFIIALMGCYHGYNSGRGAQGVGRATTQAVVSACVLILAANYVLTEFFFTS
ncbi:MAG: ABC transporter permease [Neomegalonema sp.]|nr:ABC transporter permease [Neomegalonema sp.]